MSVTEFIDTRLDTFFPLLHAMLSGKTSTAEEATQEAARAQEVMHWAADNAYELAQVLDEVEHELIGHLIHHHPDGAPSRAALEDMVRRESKSPEGQLHLLTLYDERLPFLNRIDAIEFKTIFRSREKAWAWLKRESRLIAESKERGSLSLTNQAENTRRR
jgi:hypothetical protein